MMMTTILSPCQDERKKRGGYARLPSNCVEFPDPLIRILLGQILDPDEKEPSWKYSHSRADWYVHVTKLSSVPEDIRGELESSDEGQLELVLRCVRDSKRRTSTSYLELV